ncbi:MAG: GTPase domain-containing protein [Synergistaceae bacterium]|nr:GTPase domain-containing protein [Synergistaceae bacterium]
MKGHENEEISTNVLIIGKTGVGKSSFINYLYPNAARETGAGRPVTGRGIYRSVFTTENGLAVNLYDTWGLEANRSAEWKKIILDEVKRHDKESIRDWFHTVIYCLSAKSARVERFETEQINALKAAGNRVMAVMTHCDLNNVASAIEKMSEILRCECGMPDGDIVRVSSVNKHLLGGDSPGRFGREYAVERMVSDLWGSIAEKIPAILKRRGEKMISDWRDESEDIIDDGINFFNHLSNSAVKSVLNKINRRAENCGKKFSRDVEETLSDALGYYRVFAQKYSDLVTGGFKTGAQEMPRIRSPFEHESAEDKMIHVIAHVIFPVALLFSAEMRRDEMKGSLRRHGKRMNEWLENYVVEISARLSGETPPEKPKAVDVSEKTAVLAEHVLSFSKTLEAVN